MRYFFLLLIFILIGCSSIYRNIKYEYGTSKELVMKIPGNFVFQGIQGDHELEHRYWYSDSSVIYVTIFDNTMNYDEIRKQGTYYNRFNAIQASDTLTLTGTTQNNLHWQDKLLENGITIGYSKVPDKRLVEFNNALRSVKIK